MQAVPFAVVGFFLAWPLVRLGSSYHMQAPLPQGYPWQAGLGLALVMGAVSWLLEPPPRPRLLLTIGTLIVAVWCGTSTWFLKNAEAPVALLVQVMVGALSLFVATAISGRPMWESREESSGG